MQNSCMFYVKVIPKGVYEFDPLPFLGRRKKYLFWRHPCIDSIGPSYVQTFIFQNRDFLNKHFFTEQRFIKQRHDFQSKVTD